MHTRSMGEALYWPTRSFPALDEEVTHILTTTNYGFFSRKMMTKKVIITLNIGRC